MKFRVKPKDLVIFIVFCVFLLIVSSLAVLNVVSLANSTEFFGLNFFVGFTKPYVIPTFGVFFAVLISIFMSVSSYIFDRDKGSKGIGLTFSEKEEKGYSRWLKPNEMKMAPGVVKVDIKSPTASGAGIPLINDGKTMWVDNEHSHNLVIGQTGSGKTTALVDPLINSLAKNGESMILTDPKGELYKNHSQMLRAKGYKIVVLNFRDPAMGNAWNPLTLPFQLYRSGNTDKATELLDDVALNILYDPNNKNDPFWEKSAADFFSGLALGLFQDAKEEQIHLNSINYMATVGEENFATSNYTKEYFELKGKDSNPYVFASNTINAPNETKGSILSVFRQKIRLFASREQLSEMLSYSDFNMRDIGTEKTAVFMIIHDEKTTYHALATIFIKQCYETLIDVAQKSPGGRLPHRTNFILDEFANMPPLKDVTTMVTAARSRSIRFTFIIQNFAQLNEVYGKEDAETIRSNCGNLIYLLTSELAALEEISKLCGEVKSKEKDKTASTPLITVSDLQKLKMNEVVIIKSRLNPFRTKLTPNYEIDWGPEDYGKGELVQREKRPIDLFDIKEFVKVKKRNKLFEALDNNKQEEKKDEVILPPKDILESKPIEAKEEKNDFNSFNPFNNSSIESSNPFMSRGSVENFDETGVFDDKKDVKDTSSIFEGSLFNSMEKESDNNPLWNVKSESNTNMEASESPKFDIDSLVKRIDAKIAELEKQEKLEQEAENNQDLESLDTNDYYDKLDATIVERFDDFMSDNKTEVKSEEPIINIDNDSVIVGDVTDDQYYDDFFTEE